MVDRFGLAGWGVYPTVIYDIAFPFEERLAIGAAMAWTSGHSTFPPLVWRRHGYSTTDYLISQGAAQHQDLGLRLRCQQWAAARSGDYTVLAHTVCVPDHPTPAGASDPPLDPTSSQQVVPSIPSGALPLDAPEVDSPQTVEQHILSIPPAHLPECSLQRAEMSALLLDCGPVFSLYKFDVGTVDPQRWGYFEIDTADAEPFWESPRRLSHLERVQLLERIRDYDYADVTEPTVSP